MWTTKDIFIGFINHEYNFLIHCLKAFQEFLRTFVLFVSNFLCFIGHFLFWRNSFCAYLFIATFYQTLFCRMVNCNVSYAILVETRPFEYISIDIENESTLLVYRSILKENCIVYRNYYSFNNNNCERKEKKIMSDFRGRVI